MASDSKQEFIRKVRELDTIQLRELFDMLKADGAPLGQLMFVAKEFEIRSQGKHYRRTLQ